MRNKILTEKFFNRPTAAVARGLLGKFLVRKYRGRETRFMITEVEVYDGFSDKGSHAWRGKTGRNFTMFGQAGVFYVYFTYGMHWMLNIVAGPKDYPAAVLIRGIQGFSGPGRLTKKLKIDKRFNNKPANKRTGLWMEDWGIKIRANQIRRGPRVGIDYASPFWRKRHWRFWLGQLQPNLVRPI